MTEKKTDNTKTAYIHLAPGFEEIEALTCADWLRRAGIDAKLVSVTGKREVLGVHSILVQADILFEDADSDDDPDEEEDTDEDNDEKPLRMEAQLYSTRRMGQAILNRLGVSNQVQQKPVDTSLEKPDGGAPIQPTIGMDGTTEDGSVPYLILQKQLEYLR